MAKRTTSDQATFENLPTDPALLPPAARLLWQAHDADDLNTYSTRALPTILNAVGADYAALVASRAGRWTAVAEEGDRKTLPLDLLADVLDRDAARADDKWLAAPLPPQTPSVDALVLSCRSEADAGQALAAVTQLTPALTRAITVVDSRRAKLRRIRRLEAILEIANEWNQAREVVPLFVQMAEKATQLLQADRASIFLWDRAGHTLVGRPALGVEGGELRIPDDRGVVGQVIQTKQPIRVDAATEPERIDRQVDSQLGYKTTTLLCVPMRSRSGELLGEFELINSLKGAFTAEDEAALIELAAHAAIALENAQDRQNLLSTSRQITEEAAERVQLIGESPPIEALRSIVGRVANTELAVLILGENGTGKEVVAQSIHYLSGRRAKPFIAVNCAAIPDMLAESELFGHEEGAFTDARQTRQGKFELAAEGTLFLDEVGDLSLNSQAKLLRVLEEKVLVRVGGSAPIHTEARVVAATNQNLAEMVREKRFREDLYFRLNVVTLEIPPLRDRPGDVLLLAEHFLENFSRKAHREPPELTPTACERLESHTWPGNVRELRNLMERLAYLLPEDRVDAKDLAFILAPRGDTPLVTSLDQTLAGATVEFQTEYIKRAIEQAGGNMSQAAEQLGMHRSNLYRKMRQLNMDVPN